MTKLEKLIQEYCPDGVEYKNLGEIAKIERGASPRPIKNFITTDENGVNWIKIGDVETGAKYVTSCHERITIEGAQKSRFVHSGDFILSNSMSFGRPYILKIDGCIHDGWLSISNFEEKLISDFLYYVLTSTEIQREMRQRASFGGAVQNLNADIVRAIKIPVPPLPVQAEIVRILDNFTELIAEFTAELTARKKQYEYYRNHLFEFNENVPMMALGDHFPFIRNGFVGTVTSYFTDKEHGVRYLKGTNIHNGVIADNDETYVTHEFHQKHIKNELKKDDILIVQSGHVGECAVVGEKYEGSNCHALIIMSNGGKCNSRYVMHYLQSEIGKKKLSRITTGGTVKHILASEMKKMIVPFSPLAEQERIVAILDCFDTLCNDISEGLPAEIEARQKQYEYYRDKLLTFKKLP